MKRYDPVARYLGDGEYVPAMEANPDGDYVAVADMRVLTEERTALARVLAPDLTDPNRAALLDRAVDAKATYGTAERYQRERDSALEQRTIALGAARQAKRDAQDATIGLRDMLSRAFDYLPQGGDEVMRLREEILDMLEGGTNTPAETVADLRRRADGLEYELKMVRDRLRE